MIIWLNGTFGVGKTTVSKHLVSGSTERRAFDPEWVGFMLANNLSDHEVSDFQHYPSWRRLIPVVADEVMQFTGERLVAAQSVLVQEYWHEIVDGLHRLGHEVFHVVLDADADTLHARIDADKDEPERIRPWRHRHVDVYMSARGWMTEASDLVVDTSTNDALTAAKLIDVAASARP